MKPRPDLAVEKVDDELIVLDKAAGKVHQLNPSASFVWGCLKDGMNIDEIAARLVETYDVAPETALSDVQAAVARFDALALLAK